MFIWAVDEVCGLEAAQRKQSCIQKINSQNLKSESDRCEANLAEKRRALPLPGASRYGCMQAIYGNICMFAEFFPIYVFFTSFAMALILVITIVLITIVIIIRDEMNETRRKEARRSAIAPRGFIRMRHQEHPLFPNYEWNRRFRYRPPPATDEDSSSSDYSDEEDLLYYYRKQRI